MAAENRALSADRRRCDGAADSSPGEAGDKANNEAEPRVSWGALFHTIAETAAAAATGLRDSAEGLDRGADLVETDVQDRYWRRGHQRSGLPQPR